MSALSRRSFLGGTAGTFGLVVGASVLPDRASAAPATSGVWPLSAVRAALGSSLDATGEAGAVRLTLTGVRPLPADPLLGPGTAYVAELRGARPFRDVGGGPVTLAGRGLPAQLLFLSPYGLARERLHLVVDTRRPLARTRSL